MSDSEYEVDLTEALAGPSDERSNKRAKLSAKPAANDSDDDEAFIASTMGARMLADGEGMIKTVVSKNRKDLKSSKSTLTGAGSFASMGLSPSLLRTLFLRGFSTPTPIQRAAMPSILASPPRDVVGMARTSSGKTLAYLVPLIQRLGGLHSTTFGARALIMVPTRELALQVLKVGKDLSRGAKAKEVAESGESLRWGLIVGGEGIEEQFSALASNPDV